jgi:para-aminobenzoate synthetase/4-amino-4-deoxychorismate lyase
MQAALARGLYAVPVLSYELARAAARHYRRKPRPPPPPAPLAQVLLFERYELSAEVGGLAGGTRRPASGPAGIANIARQRRRGAFTRAIERIRDYIAAGDTYQVNYTYRLRFDAFGSIHALYARLRARQPVPYGALVGCPTAAPCCRCRPNCSCATSRRLLARPMKGTAPAAATTPQTRPARQPRWRRPQEPRRKPDDRRPAAQRPRTHRAHRQRRRAGAVRGARATAACCR